MSETRNLRKARVGTVVSDKMDKTVVVAIRDNVKHPLYKKIRLWKPVPCPKTSTGE